jgi:hypothetical protein
MSRTRKAPEPKTDFVVSCHGNVYLVRPMNDAARTWIDEHVKPEGWQWFGGALAVDQHYVSGLCDFIADDGLRVTNSANGFH